MGFIPPPRPLTREEFQKRIDDGAKTLFEIDPALGEWANRGIVGFFNKCFGKSKDKRIVNETKNRKAVN